MNKAIALLILGVILLAMALIMANQFITQEDGTATAPVVTAPVASGGSGAEAATPETLLAELEQRAANSELSPKETGAPVAPPLPQTIAQPKPAWPASATVSGQGVESVRGSVAHGDAATASVPSVPEQAKSAPAEKASVKTEPAKNEKPKSKSDSVKAEPAKAEQVKSKGKAESENRPKEPRTVRKLVVFRTDDGVTVRVEGSESLEYKTMHLKSPERVVVDLEGVWAIKAPGVPDNRLVGNVRIGKQSDKTRIVIDLKQTPQDVKYIKRGIQGLDVRIR